MHFKKKEKIKVRIKNNFINFPIPFVLFEDVYKSMCSYQNFLALFYFKYHVYVEANFIEDIIQQFVALKIIEFTWILYYY